MLDFMTNLVSMNIHTSKRVYFNSEKCIFTKIQEPYPTWKIIMVFILWRTI